MPVVCNASAMRAPLLTLGLGALLLACGSADDEPSGESTSDLVTNHAQARLEGGQLVIDTPMPAVCTGASCVDSDGDGLSDAWEDAILERLRPKLVLHPEEPNLVEDDGAMGLIGRVFRPAGAPANIVRVIIVVGFAFDDGVSVLGLGVTGHDGDSERVALELDLQNGGRRAVLHRAFFSAHENMPSDHSSLYAPADLPGALSWATDADGQPRWLVWPSKSKHAEFANAAACADSSLWGTTLFQEQCPDDVASGVVVTPPMVNAGEHDRPRVADLGVVGFPGESAWDGSSFCGGLRTRDRSRHFFCGGAVAKKLSDDPFL